jgi:hypothetical protein
MTPFAQREASQQERHDAGWFVQIADSYQEQQNIDLFARNEACQPELQGIARFACRAAPDWRAWDIARSCQSEGWQVR